MELVKFGQIVGFKYKGTISIPNKHKPGEFLEVKDYALHQDPKIVNEKWLEENKDNMPEVIKVVDSQAKDLHNLVEELKTSDKNDIPFSSSDSLTNEDKLIAIAKLAKEKLGATDDQSVKEKVMESTSIAFIPINYDKILEALTVKGF